MHIKQQNLVNDEIEVIDISRKSVDPIETINRVLDIIQDDKKQSADREAREHEFRILQEKNRKEKDMAMMEIFQRQANNVNQLLEHINKSTNPLKRSYRDERYSPPTKYSRTEFHEIQ